MKAYLKAVAACIAFACIFLFVASMLWIGETVLAVNHGVSRWQMEIAVLAFALIAGAVKVVRDRQKAHNKIAALNKAIELWEAALKRIEDDVDADAERAVYFITIEALKNERNRARI